jgi:hypothetical protein
MRVTRARGSSAPSGPLTHGAASLEAMLPRVLRVGRPGHDSRRRPQPRVGVRATQRGRERHRRMGAWLLGDAPDWEDVKPLAWVGFTAAVTAACSFPATVDAPLAVYAWTSRVQVLAIALHIAAWYAYFGHWTARRPAARRWALLSPLLAVGVLALVPGLVRGEAVTLRSVRWLGIVYHDPVVTRSATWPTRCSPPTASSGWSGSRCSGAIGCRSAARTSRSRWRSRHGRSRRRGRRPAARTPSLLDFALYGPAVVIAAFTLHRVVQTATDLRRLRAGLEMAVVGAPGAPAGRPRSPRPSVSPRSASSPPGSRTRSPIRRCWWRGASPARARPSGGRSRLSRRAICRTPAPPRPDHLARAAAPRRGPGGGTGTQPAIEVRVRPPSTPPSRSRARRGGVGLEATVAPGTTSSGTRRASRTSSRRSC